MLEYIGGYIKEYQTFASSLVGFTGIIITLIVNGMISRANQSALRRKEANSIKEALIAEINVNITIIKNSFDEWSKDKLSDGMQFVYENQYESSVYDALVGKVGMLKTKEAEAIISAYAILNTFLRNMRILAFTDNGTDVEEAVYLIKLQSPNSIARACDYSKLYTGYLEQITVTLSGKP